MCVLSLITEPTGLVACIFINVTGIDYPHLRTGVCSPTGEITYFDFHVIIEEDVAQFQVPVDDSVVVQVLDTIEQLGHVVASLRLSHSLTTFVQLQQRLK